MNFNVMSREAHGRNASLRGQQTATPRGHHDTEGSSHAARTITCGHCESENAADRRFCAQCGQSLGETCAKCGAEHSCVETFCGKCGHNVAAAFHQRREQIQHDLARADELAQEYQFDHAISLLGPLTTHKQPRLLSLAQQASDSLEKILAARDRHRAEADAALQQAQQFLAAHAYEKAIAALEAVPQALRNGEIAPCLEAAQSKRREVLSLAGEIREALQAKRWLELAPRLERLVALQPHNKQARDLAEQLRQRLEIAAKKHLADSQYEQALELLHLIPSFARTSDSEKLVDHAAELAWLNCDLRSEPIVDETLLGIAERLIKLDPKNALAGRHLESLRRRSLVRMKDPRTAAAPWAAQPQSSSLGCTIDWLGGAAQFSSDETQRVELLREHRGRFFVAMGLALQGIGQAHVSINLIPEEATKKSFLPNFSLSRRKPTVKTAWGLDLGGSSLKAVKLSYDERDGQVRLLACDFIEHAKLLGQPDAEFQRAALVEETLKTFLARNDIAADQVCVSMSGAKLLGRFFEMPRVPEKKIAEVITREVSHQIPFPLGELTWNYQFLDEPVAATEVDDAENYRPYHVLLLAAKHDHVADHLAPLTNLDIKVDVLQSDCLALHNFAVREFFTKEPSDGDGDAKDRAADHKPPIALMDVGSEATNIVISSPDSVWFRSFGVGGNDFARALVRQYNLSFAAAEQLKQNPLKAPRVSQLYGALEPEFSKLVKDVQRSMAAMTSERPGQSVQRLCGVGGGFYLHGLLRYLWRGAWLDADFMEPK
jgi:type IV pilus assembly protein PilM